MNFRFLQYSAVLFALSSSIALAQSTPVRHAPRVCTGFSEDAKSSSWGLPETGMCPKDYLVLGAVPGGIGWSTSRYASDGSISLKVSCCPVPVADLLLDDHLFEASHCAEGRVATGVEYGVDESEQFRIRCTKINSKRYQLGASTKGASWGMRSTYWKHAVRVMKRDIPAGYRHSLGRVSFEFWETSGCVSYPFGGVLVAKERKRCHDLYFREVQYTGLPGDPPSGTRVALYKDCSEVDDVYSTEPGCLAPQLEAEEVR